MVLLQHFHFMGIYPLQLVLGAIIYRRTSSRLRRRMGDRFKKAMATEVLTDIDTRGLTILTKHDILTNLPAWFSFPEYERVLWLNSIMETMWPELNKAVSTIVLETVNPILEQVCPKSIHSIELDDRFTLGDLAPKFGGIASQVKSGKDGKDVVLDIDFKWGSSSDILVKVKTKQLIKLKAGLHDFQMFGRVRVILTHFVPQLPCIGAVVVSFLQSPKVDFDLRVQGSNIADAIGLEGIIQGIITKVVDGLLLWPQRMIFPLVPGVDPKSLEPKAVGILYINLIGVRDLVSTDLIGKADPYVEMGVNKARQVKSAKVDDKSDHDFNEIYQFRVIDVDTQKLSITVWDYDRVGSDEVIGQLEIPLSRMGSEELIGKLVKFNEYIKVPEKSKNQVPGGGAAASGTDAVTQTIGLKGRDKISRPEGTSGRVELEALYIPFDAPEDFDLPVDCFSLPPPGVLWLRVKYIVDLYDKKKSQAGRSMYVRARIGSMVRETYAQEIRHSNDALYNEDIYFIGIDVEQDPVMKLELMRLPNRAEKLFLKKEKMKATLEIGLKAIAESGFLDEEIQLEGIKSGKLALSIHYLTNDQVTKYRKLQMLQSGVSVSRREATDNEVDVPESFEQAAAEVTQPAVVSTEAAGIDEGATQPAAVPSAEAEVADEGAPLLGEVPAEVEGIVEEAIDIVEEAMDIE